MAAGRCEAEWDRVAWSLAHLYELHRDHKKRRRPFSPEEFLPKPPKKRSSEPQPETMSDEAKQVIRCGICRGRKAPPGSRGKKRSAH